jgi:hypothetical protein
MVSPIRSAAASSTHGTTRRIKLYALSFNALRYGENVTFIATIVNGAKTIADLKEE